MKGDVLHSINTWKVKKLCFERDNAKYNTFVHLSGIFFTAFMVFFAILCAQYFQTKVWLRKRVHFKKVWFQVDNQLGTLKFSKSEFTDFGALHFNPMLARQRITDNSSIDRRSYEVIQPDSASSPVISDKQCQGICSEVIVHFSDRVHTWWRRR